MTRIVPIMSALALIAVLIVPAAASAQDNPMIAVLPLQASAKVGLGEEDVSYLTDVARGTAAKVLGEAYIVQTEQNMQRILSGMGLTLEQCMAKSGDCEVEIARKLQADYAVAGRIRHALGKLKLTIQLYATGSGALLGQHDDTLREISALEGSVRAGIGALLATLPGAVGGVEASGRPADPPLKTPPSESTALPVPLQGEALTAGHRHTCAIKTDGSIACWGLDLDGSTRPPAGSFQSVSAGHAQTCGVTGDGAAVCWGQPWPGNATPPSGAFRSVSTGGRLACGVRADGTLACWGHGVDLAPPAGVFQTVSAGTDHACGIKRDGSAACWGEEVQFPNLPPEGSFRSIAAGDGYTCGVKSDGSLVCWSLYDSGENNLPRGTFEAVAAGPGHTCALRTDGSVACWGDHGAGQSSPLGGAFLAIATGGSHSCGVRSNGSVACWGLNENEQCVPPADLQVPTTP